MLEVPLDRAGLSGDIPIASVSFSVDVGEEGPGADRVVCGPVVICSFRSVLVSYAVEDAREVVARLTVLKTSVPLVSPEEVPPPADLVDGRAEEWRRAFERLRGPTGTPAITQDGTA